VVEFLLCRKPITKKGLVEWLKVYALSSNHNTTKKREKERKRKKKGDKKTKNNVQDFYFCNKPIKLSAFKYMQI
jgi:hypothetical protein